MYDNTRYNTNSRFWLNDDYYQKLRKKYTSAPDVNLGDLVSKNEILKTISNFVNIVTNSNIPVKFQGQEAKTDGKEIFISANVNDFDLVCGLSLHEASHVKYSQDLHELLKTVPGELNALGMNKYTKLNNPIVAQVAKWIKDWNIPLTYSAVDKVYSYLHTLMNIVEDFRIDSLNMQNFPGYKGYYAALTSKYLITESVTNQLKNDPKLSAESYFSYKMNLAAFLGGHPANNLLKLKGGKEIVGVVDPKTITDKSALDVFDMCVKVFEIINKYVVENKQPDEKNETSESGENKDKSKSENKENSDEKSNETSKDPEDGEIDDSPKNDDLDNENENETGNGTSDEESDEDEDGDGNGNGSGDEESDEDESEDSENGSGDEDEDIDGEEDANNSNDKANASKTDPLEQLDFDQDSSKAFQELLDAIKGDYKKSKLTAAQVTALDLISNNKFKIKTTYVDDYSGKKHKVDVVVINKLDESILDYINIATDGQYASSKLRDAVNVGLNLGRSLGSKLQLMNDTHITKSIRRRDGNIESRLLSEVGHGNVKIFNRTSKTEYEKQFVHISIDSSGSMDGYNFRNSLQMAANIAAAGTFVNGMRVQVSIRSTAILALGGNRDFYNGKAAAYVAVIYDSKYDKLSHIKNWWPRLLCPGNTPEALCFDAIKDIILDSSKDKNSYFVNISDGAPVFSITPSFGYGTIAVEHTQKVMKDFRKAGLKVISYFIDGHRNTSDMNFFKDMYGKDAQFINVQNINEVARTLNKKFLEV